VWANSCILRERRVFAEGEELGSGQHCKPAQESRWVTTLSFKEPVKPSLVLQWFSEVVNVLYGTSYGST